MPVPSSFIGSVFMFSCVLEKLTELKRWQVFFSLKKKKWLILWFRVADLTNLFTSISSGNPTQMTIKGFF